MPIYEFRCKDCATVFEALLSSYTEAGTTACRNCGSKNIEKLMSSFSSKSSAAQGKVPAGAFHGCSAPGGSGFS